MGAANAVGNRSKRGPKMAGQPGRGAPKRRRGQPLRRAFGLTRNRWGLGPPAFGQGEPAMGDQARGSAEGPASRWAGR